MRWRRIISTDLNHKPRSPPMIRSNRHKKPGPKKPPGKEAVVHERNGRLVAQAGVAPEAEIRAAGDDRFLSLAYPKKR